MSDYQIRFAEVSDVEDIMSFIKNHWKEQHILAQNKPFFLYEYGNDKTINFAIARDVSTNELVGLCGFIKNTKELNGSDVWGSLWKVIQHPGHEVIDAVILQALLRDEILVTRQAAHRHAGLQTFVQRHQPPRPRRTHADARHAHAGRIHLGP